MSVSIRTGKGNRQHFAHSLVSKNVVYMTIIPIIQKLANLDRQAMIWQLQSELNALKLYRERLLIKSTIDSELSIDIRKREGILIVIESVQKPSSHYLSDQEFQELRPIMQHFIETGDLDEYIFKSIY